MRRRTQELVVAAVVGATAMGCLNPAPPVTYYDRPTRRTRPTSAARGDHPRIGHKLLPSGLMVVLEQDMNATAVGVVAVVRGGAGADPVGKEGLAHLVEHLTYRAVDSKPDAPLPLAAAAPASTPNQTRWERLIRYAAAGVNALTGPDGISFFEFGPPSRLDWLLDIEAARLSDPLAGITPAAVALERQVIAVENQLHDDPRGGGWVSRQMMPVVFPASHPYARAVGGTDESRARLTLADARAFAADTFRPERTTLLVSAPTALTTLDKIIAHLPPAWVGDAAHPVARPLAQDPQETPVADAPPAAVQRRPSPLPSPQLWMGWSLPGSYGAQAPMEDLLARWVREDLDLDQLRQDDPHIRYVDAMLLGGARSSVLFVRALLDDGADPERVAQVVGGRVGSLWTRGPAQHPLLERLKATVRTELELDEPPQLARAIDQAETIAFGPAPILRANLLVKAAAISDSDLAGFAYAHLKTERAHAVFFTPAPPARTEAAHRAAPAAAPGLDEPFRDAAAWDPMGLPGTPSPVRDVIATKLDNGLTVIAARRPVTGTVAWLAFRGGYSDVDPPLVVDLALRTRPDATEAAKLHMLSGRGATRDSSIETMEFPVDALMPALRVLLAKGTVGVRAWPPQDGLDRLLAPVHADEDPASQQAVGAFLAALFGDSPLARRSDKADLKRTTRSGVESWIGRVHTIRNAALVVVGDIDPSDVVDAVRSVTSQMNTPAWVEGVGELPLPAARPPAADHTALVVTPRRGALVDVHLGCLLPRATPADLPYHRLLGLAIQQRLNSNLRVQHGEGYGVNVSDEVLRGGTAYLTLETFLDASDLIEPLAAIRANWTRWGHQGFDAGEVNVARALFAGELPVEYSSAHLLAYHLLQAWKLDPKAASAAQFHVDVSHLKAERLAELFATCKANAVLGLTGDEAAISRAVARAWPGLQPSPPTAAR